MERPVDVSRALADLAQRCRAQSVPLTVQRRAVLAALLARDDHPTPDDVFEDVRARLPGISRGTTYRVLDKLVELGLVVRVCHHGAVARYDAKTHRHHHVVCDRCDAVVDLECSAFDALPLPDLTRSGFRLRDYSVHLRGLCERCANGRQARPSTRARSRPAPSRATGRSPAPKDSSSRTDSNRRRRP